MVVTPPPPRPFQEFKVYDKARQNRDWMSLLSATQCAVFFKDFQTAVPLSHDGVAFDKMTDCTFLVFDRIDEARRFCQARVNLYPSMCCEVFDFEGKAKAPLAVIVHPGVAETDDLSASWVRRRKVIAMVAFVGAIPLLVWDWRTGSYLILPTVVAIHLIVFGLRYLYWNTARDDRSKERAHRLANHLQREREEESHGKSR
jgi:hypothetical protein